MTIYVRFRSNRALNPLKRAGLASRKTFVKLKRAVICISIFHLRDNREMGCEKNEREIDLNKIVKSLPGNQFEAGKAMREPLTILAMTI